MKVCSERTPGSVNFSFYQSRGVTGLFVMNHDESNPSLRTSLTRVRGFFFFARLCILSDAHDSGTTPILKGVLFLFFQDCE